MNFRNIGIVISREFMTRVRKKSFLIITFLGPILFAAIAVIPSLIMFLAEDKGKNIAVVDESGIAMTEFVSNDSYTFTDRSGESLDSLKANLSADGIDVLVHISPLIDSIRSVNVVTYSDKALSMDLKEAIALRVDNAVEDYRIACSGIEDLRGIMDKVKSDVSITTYTIDDSGEEKLDSAELKMIVSMLLGMVIYMFIAMFSGMVMSSVIEEKASRVVEVLISSVKATELMFGKIVGVACVALTQFLLWVVLTIGIITVAGSVMGFDKIAQSQTGMMPGTEMAGVDAEAMMSNIDAGDNSLIVALMDLNYSQIIVSFLVFFVLGYLLYASLFAAIGSAVENEADSSQLQLPITIPLLIGFFIAIYSFKSPDSAIAVWGSMIPFTSPIVMLARIPFGVPVWQLVLSIALLLVTFVLCAWVSAKIYRAG
ncbi:MAG: ABC transporter permease, partial [Candidatus Cryptobacteroides sp.]